MMYVSFLSVLAMYASLGLAQSDERALQCRVALSHCENDQRHVQCYESPLADRLVRPAPGEPEETIAFARIFIKEPYWLKARYVGAQFTLEMGDRGAHFISLNMTS